MPARATRPSRTTPPSRCAWLVLGAMLAWVAGCGTDLDARAANTLYACVVPTDCVAGYSCVCGFCQRQGSAIQVCGEDTDAVGDDTVGNDSASLDTASNDTASNDTADTADTGGGCSPRTWVGCATGQGCYADAKNQTYCVKTGSGTSGAACDPTSTTPPCGMDGGKPLICDSVEKKCLPLCDTSAPDCNQGWTCYPIGIPAWPDHTGVCAP